MCAQSVYIVHAEKEDKLAEQLAEPIRQAGYIVHHRGTVLVGDSYLDNARCILDKGGAVVLCITAKSAGTNWAPTIINSILANHGYSRIFPVLMEKDARYQNFNLSDLRIVDCSQNFGAGIAALLNALQQKFPSTQTCVNIRPWLIALVGRVSHIQISGIGSGDGRAKNAALYPIEELYTVLYSQGEPVSLAELLPRYRRLLIEGQPGAGKTTFLHLVATMSGRDYLNVPREDDKSWCAAHLSLDTDRPPLTPLFLKLSELTLILDKDPITSRDDRTRLLDLLDIQADATPGPEWREHWKELLGKGETILLLDGLDEVADDTIRERIFNIFRDVCKHWGNCPMVITSRPISVGAVKAMGFHHVVIAPFREAEIREFVNRWIAALHSLPIGEHPAGEPGAKAERVITAVLTRPAIRRMATNPVMLTCLCVVHWNEGELPEGRARLFKTVINWLIRARKKQRKEDGFHDEFAQEALAALAFSMMSGGSVSLTGNKVAILDFERAAEVVAPLIRRYFPQAAALSYARRWLRFECVGSGIITEQTGNFITFWHLIFQEYLAAADLAARGDADTMDDWWPYLKDRLDNLQWRETLELFPGALLDEGGKRRVDLLLRRVIDFRGESADVEIDAQTFGILARLQALLAVYNYCAEPTIEQRLNEFRQRTLSMFAAEGAAKIPAAKRIAAAEALGRGIDPRLAENNFIKVPNAGRILLGKYPVTVQEFAEFVDAGGYDEEKIWSPVGWRVRLQREWVSPRKWANQIEHPNRPITDVSWYEAEAWCHWRSDVTGLCVRLPTEHEWRMAAAPDGRSYPWGDELPNVERTNFDCNVNHPTPVGVYPAGNGPFGHCDLAGNVSEWCLNACPEQPHDESANLYQQGDQRVFCGGSWRHGAREIRVIERLWLPPTFHENSLGFRCAVAPNANMNS